MIISIKQHIIRINVKGKGYSLYTGNPDWGFEEQSLNVSTRQIPESFLLAQQKLDTVLKTGKLSWSMSFRHDSRNTSPIVAYGSFTEAPDDKGRIGIFFIHAIELKHPNGIHSCVESIIALLSHKMIRDLTRIIADLAIGKLPADKSLLLISRNLEKRIEDWNDRENFIYQSKDENIRIRAIVHDCAGAAALAWLTTAYLKNNSNPPWEVYDMVDETGNIQTFVTSNDNQIIHASGILRRDVKQYLDSILSNQPRPQIPIPLIQKKSIEILSKQEEISKTFPPKSETPIEKSSRGKLIKAFLFSIVLLLVILIMSWSNKRNEPESSAIQQLEQRNDELIAEIDEKSEQIRKLQIENENHVRMITDLEKEVERLKSQTNIPTGEITQAPSDSRKDITIEYYARDFDRQKVESVLKEFGFKLDIKNTGSPQIPTNYIRFGSNINIEDVKLVACRVIEAGLQIKSIAPFSNPLMENASKVQIAADSRCENLQVWTCTEIRHRSEFK
jgi:hypothetical protein